MMLDNQASNSSKVMPCHQVQPDDDQQTHQCSHCQFCLASGTVVIENTDTSLTTQHLQARYVINAPLNLNVQHYPPAIRPPIS